MALALGVVLLLGCTCACRDCSWGRGTVPLRRRLFILLPATMEFLAAGAGLSLLVVAALASDASGGSLVMAVRISGRAEKDGAGPSWLNDSKRWTGGWRWLAR